MTADVSLTLACLFLALWIMVLSNKLSKCGEQIDALTKRVAKLEGDRTGVDDGEYGKDADWWKRG